MKTVIEFFYGVGFGGILLQIVPGVPDYISYTMIVFGLSTAIVAQWRQSIKDRKIHREDIREMKTEFKDAIKENTSVNQAILEKLTGLDEKYRSDNS